MKIRRRVSEGDRPKMKIRRRVSEGDRPKMKIRWRVSKGDRPKMKIRWRASSRALLLASEPVNECPQCGAAYGDGIAFCETDGAALGASPPVSGPISPRASEVPPATPCTGCGAIGSDDGDGYCATCGQRLALKSVAPSIPPKALVGRWAVVEARGLDDFVCRTREREDGLLIVGPDAAIEAEAVALASLAGDAALPGVLDQGQDARWGAFLTVTPVDAGARLVADAARKLRVDQALALLRAAVDLAERVERAGFDWAPLRDDFYVTRDGRLFVARLRGARTLAAPERLDARGVSEALGSAFLPFPAVDGSTRMVRFVSAHYVLRAGIDGGPPGVVENERAEILALEAERVASEPPDEGVAPKDVAPSVVCDAGMKRGYNEDAGDVARGEPGAGLPAWSVLVVCDGVSSSMHAEKASAIASRTACDALARFARAGVVSREDAPRVVSTAVRAAHIAICAQRFDHGIHEPPGTTIVVALVQGRRITVGWVGDSRAYFVVPGGGELLTRDHSWVNETVARGDMTEAEAMRQPLAHALTRCLGPLESGEGIELAEPDVRVREVTGPGLVVLCSDGLWNYFPGAKDIARLLARPGAPMVTRPRAVARLLVNHALERGGHDNVTVAVCAVA
jgi:serine/threonine protein phosphatase PrpC